MGPIFDEQVCYALYSTSNLVTQAYKSLLEPLQLTYPQFVVMMALWQKDKVSVTQLALDIGITKATMTPILKRLEMTGYVSRDFVEGDERQKSITLTTSGQSLVSNGRDVAEQALCATGLSHEEATQLISLCNKVKSNLS